jgi:hypothetical protein
MGGIRPEDRSANDGAYSVVFLLAVISFFLTPVLAVFYLLLIIATGREKRDQSLKDMP